MKVLLSIKPEFADKIFDGTKRFEYRRTIFSKTYINTVIVYASSPVQRVIGEFEINQVLFDDIDNLWSLTRDYAGIDEDYFFRYFSDRNKGYAIEIKKVKKYKNPFHLQERFKIQPPQSFAYIKWASLCVLDKAFLK